MAVIVSSTTVIDDNQRLQNVAGANGNYDNFQPNVTTLSSSATVAVSMNSPFLDLTLAQNAALTVGDKALGKVSVLALDTSATPYAPTFDANVKWPADTEPTWSSHRYWNISLVCWDSTTVRAAAVGFDA